MRVDIRMAMVLLTAKPRKTAIMMSLKFVSPSTFGKFFWVFVRKSD